MPSARGMATNERAAAPFLGSDVDLVLGVKDFEFCRPHQLRLLKKFQVAPPSVRDLHGNRFVSAGMSREAFWVTDNCAQRLAGARAKATLPASPVRMSQSVGAVQSDPHVPNRSKSFSSNVPVCWGMQDFPDGGHTVAFAVDELGFPARVRHVDCFLPKAVEFRDVLIANVQVVVPVVNLVVQHDRFPEVQGALAGLNRSDQIPGGLPLGGAVAAFCAGRLGSA